MRLNAAHEYVTIFAAVAESVRTKERETVPNGSFLTRKRSQQSRNTHRLSPSATKLRLHQTAAFSAAKGQNHGSGGGNWLTSAHRLHSREDDHNSHRHRYHRRSLLWSLVAVGRLSMRDAKSGFAPGATAKTPQRCAALCIHRAGAGEMCVAALAQAKVITGKCFAALRPLFAVD